MLIYIYTPTQTFGLAIMLLVVRWRKGDFITWLYVAGYSTQSEE